MGPFERLFGIHVHHAYFGDEHCRQLSWAPAPETRDILENLGMLMRRESDGMTIYYDVRRSEAMKLLAAQSEEDMAGLFFKVNCRDPYFLNYTELPGYDGETLLYLDSDSAVAESGKNYRLHHPALVSEIDPTPLSHLGDMGLLARRDLGAPPLCVVRIRLAGREASPMDTDGNIDSRCYHVYFDHRRTYWKYYLSGPLSTRSVTIMDPDRQWTFKPVTAEEPASAGPMKAFVSSNPIPLLQKPAYRFQLRLKASNRSRVLINTLPVAPVNMIHRAQRGNEEVYTSEIFISS